MLCTLTTPEKRSSKGQEAMIQNFFQYLRSFGTFQKDSGSLELFKGSHVHNQEQKVTEEWLLPKFILRTSYLFVGFHFEHAVIQFA